ncbi:MAG TPA: hypothetical protein VGM37_01240 [Armatimonadota bacterium]|jgi:hypothetical protein
MSITIDAAPALPNVAPGAPEARDTTIELRITEQHIAEACEYVQADGTYRLDRTPLAIALTEALADGEWAEQRRQWFLMDQAAANAVQRPGARPLRDAWPNAAGEDLMLAWQLYCQGKRTRPDPCVALITIRERSPAFGRYGGSAGYRR